MQFFDEGVTLILKKRAILAVVTTLFVAQALIGCSRQPQVADVQQFLTQQVPKDSPYSIGTIQIETSKIDGDKQLVKFKADQRLEKALFRQVDAEEYLRKTGWEDSQFSKAVSDLQLLPADTARKIVETHSLATNLPTVIEQVAKSGETRSWYGSVEGSYLVDKWSFSNLATRERGDFKGEPREKFGTRTYLLGDTDTAEVIEAAKKARSAFVEAVATNIQLVAERQSRKQAERKAEELSLAQEQSAKAADAAKRRLPIQIVLRAASFDPNSKVLVIRNTSANPLSIDLLTSDGRLQKRFQLNLPVGQPVEVGWLQGWKFKSGDKIVIQNMAYDPFRIQIP